MAVQSFPPISTALYNWDLVYISMSKHLLGNTDMQMGTNEWFEVEKKKKIWKWVIDSGNGMAN